MRAIRVCGQVADCVTVAIVVLMLPLLAGCASLQASSPLTAPGGGASTPGASGADPVTASEEATDYDPWHSFNQRTFWFNYNVLDRYGLKPVARFWNRVVPASVTRGLNNVFDNVGMPARFVNDVLQGRLESANGELTRFVINSSIGLAGFFDVAGRLGLRVQGADMGETLALYGVGAGPYLVLPLMYPSTVRDTIGYGVDIMLDPVGFIVPLAASFGSAATQRINERAVNLKTYGQVEESSLDLYAAVRNAYLQRRIRSINAALEQRDQEIALMRQTFANLLFLGDADDAGGQPEGDRSSPSP